MAKLVKLSIVIPSYNSQSYVTYVIDRVIKVLEAQKTSFEVIVVCDGCTDDTQNLAENKARKHPGVVRVFGYSKNQGKGFAVRYGMQNAKGEVVGFIDCDKEIDATSINELLKVFYAKSADIVVGSKRHKNAKLAYPFTRRVISLLYYIFVKLLFGLPVSDTQAGVKLYKKTVFEKIKSQLLIKGFAFDVEMLVLARKRGFTKLFDAPIYVNAVKSSDASILKSFGIVNESIKMFWDTLLFFFRISLI